MTGASGGIGSAATDTLISGEHHGTCLPDGGHGAGLDGAGGRSVREEVTYDAEKGTSGPLRSALCRGMLTV